MKSLLSWPITPQRIWEFSLVLILFYLLLNPPMTYPQSTALALGGGLVLLLFKAIPPGSLEKMGRVWWLFLSYLLLSCFESLLPGLTLQSAGFAFVGTLLYLMAQSNDDETKKRLEFWVLVMGLVAALAALYERYFGFDQIFLAFPHLSKMEFRVVEKAVYYHRPSGFLATPGALSALLILLLPLGLLQAQTNRGFKRVLYASCTLVLLCALWNTKSVGAWGSLTLAILLVFLWRGLWKWALLITAGGAAVILGVIWVRGAQHWGISSFNMRFLLWGSAWDLFLRHPLLGTGLGTFDEAYQEAGFSLVQGGARYPHNLILQLLSETGVLGTGLFLAAAVGFLRRLKLPSRWESWGILTGAMAFILFSFLDLPFQMPELVWVFAFLAGRLETRPEKPIRLPQLPLKCVEWFLLAVLLVSGFWPPFQAWNMALMACALWAVLALMGRSLGALPLWVAAGGFFVVLRAFFSPSALGAVWFMELTGLALVFWLVASGLPSAESFFRRFCLLGLVWGGVAWFNSFKGIPFEAWASSTNPKHLAVFLIPLVFLFFPDSFSQPRPWLVSLAALATMVRLRATGALLGFAAGIAFIPKLSRNIKIALLAALVVGAATVHGIQPSSTQWDRWMIWKSSLQVWALHPLVGNGPGVFEDGFQKVKSPRSGGLSRYLMEAGYSHNEYLELLTSFGLLGAAYLAALLFHWVRQAPKAHRPAIAGVGLSAFLDFCLHTPRVALQAVLLGSLQQNKKNAFSWAGGFLALGLCAALFGPAVWVRPLQEEAQRQENQSHFPLELRLLGTAERLNAWDAKAAWPKAQMLEKLYLATGDPEWKAQADDAISRVLELEPMEGKWLREKAGLLSERVLKEKTPESFAAAAEAWRQAEGALPFSAYLRYDEAMFYLWNGHKEEAAQCLQKAVELEPHYAVAAAKLGLLLQEEGKKAEARQAFGQALQAYDAWQGKPVDDPEKPMLAIPPGVLNQMRKEVQS